LRSSGCAKPTTLRAIRRLSNPLPGENPLECAKSFNTTKRVSTGTAAALANGVFRTSPLFPAPDGCRTMSPWHQSKTRAQAKMAEACWNWSIKPPTRQSRYRTRAVLAPAAARCLARALARRPQVADTELEPFSQPRRGTALRRFCPVEVRIILKPAAAHQRHAGHATTERGLWPSAIMSVVLKEGHLQQCGYALQI